MKGRFFIVAGIGVACVLGLYWPQGVTQDQPGGKGDKDNLTAARVKHKPLKGGLHEIKCSFPNDTDPKRTTWRVVFTTNSYSEVSNKAIENLVIQEAFFQTGPNVPECQVLAQTELIEALVPYADGADDAQDAMGHDVAHVW